MTWCGGVPQAVDDGVTGHASYAPGWALGPSFHIPARVSLTHDKRTLLFDKKRLYDIGERHLSDAKKYLYAHNQEKNVEESREYRYYFPQSVLKSTQSTPKHLS